MPIYFHWHLDTVPTILRLVESTHYSFTLSTLIYILEEQAAKKVMCKYGVIAEIQNSYTICSISGLNDFILYDLQANCLSVSMKISVWFGHFFFHCLNFIFLCAWWKSNFNNCAHEHVPCTLYVMEITWVATSNFIPSLSSTPVKGLGPILHIHKCNVKTSLQSTYTKNGLCNEVGDFLHPVMLRLKMKKSMAMLSYIVGG